MEAPLQIAGSLTIPPRDTPGSLTAIAPTPSAV